MSENKEALELAVENGTRLHKFSPIFILIYVIRKSIIPLALGVFTYGSSNYAKTLVIAAGIFIAFFAILQYWFYHYWLTEEKIEIKEGILFKKNRKVPYTRIQNVNVEQNILQRFFKVATLQLESASGGKPEAVMRVVSLDVVEKIKAKVKAASNQSALNKSVTEGEDKSLEENQFLHDIPTKDVIKYGIISQKGMFYGAILFSFMAQNQMFVAAFTKYLNILYKIPDFSKITLAEGFVYVAIVGIALFVFLQLMSILWALMKFYQFNIEKHDDRLQAHMGLISKVSATIPLKKIQLYRITENPLHKYFKAQTIGIETAGGVNTDQSGIVMRWLAPYIKKTKVKGFIHEIESKIKLGSVDWKLIPQRAWKRVFKRTIFVLGLFTLILLALNFIPQIQIRFYAWIIIALLVPMAYIYSKAYVKKTAYFCNDDIICFKSGVWFGKQSFVKISKIQTIEIHESPFDRRNNMATLEIDTAGSNILLHHVQIPYLAMQEAIDLKIFLEDKLKTTEFDW